MTDEYEEAAPDGEGRIECAYQSSVTLSKKMRLHYACVTLRGYYPDDGGKENQDAHIELPRFEAGSDEAKAFFGVFDGHGSDGHSVSSFVRDTLPQQMLHAMHEYPNDFSAACREAFLKTDSMVEHARCACPRACARGRLPPSLTAAPRRVPAARSVTWTTRCLGPRPSPSW